MWSRPVEKWKTVGSSRLLARRGGASEARDRDSLARSGVSARSRLHRSRRHHPTRASCARAQAVSCSENANRDPLDAVFPPTRRQANPAARRHLPDCAFPGIRAAQASRVTGRCMFAEAETPAVRRRKRQRRRNGLLSGRPSNPSRRAAPKTHRVRQGTCTRLGRTMRAKPTLRKAGSQDDDDDGRGWDRSTPARLRRSVTLTGNLRMCRHFPRAWEGSRLPLGSFLRVLVWSQSGQAALLVR